MRGFPLINLLAVFGALAALLIPLLRLNTPARAGDVELSGSADIHATSTELPVRLSLRFVREPLALEVKAEGRTLEFPAGGLERAASVTLPLHDKALELDVRVTWPPDAAGSVAEISVAPNGLEDRRQNVWAEGTEASEILRFEWKK